MSTNERAAESALEFSLELVPSKRVLKFGFAFRGGAGSVGAGAEFRLTLKLMFEFRPVSSSGEVRPTILGTPGQGMPAGRGAKATRRNISSEPCHQKRVQTVFPITGWLDIIASMRIITLVIIH